MSRVSSRVCFPAYVGKDLGRVAGRGQEYDRIVLECGGDDVIVGVDYGVTSLLVGAPYM